MHEEPGQGADMLAVAVGVAAVTSAVSLALLFAVGDPFGRINDVANAATGVLSGCLAWRLRHRTSDRLRAPAVASAAIGAALTVVGSALVVSGSTGFFLAGLVSSVGFAGVGVWLIALDRGHGPWSSRFRRLRMLTGSLMALGILAAPGIVLRIDDMSTAPWWIWIASLGWLGVYVLYPVWAIRSGTTDARAVVPTASGVPSAPAD